MSKREKDPGKGITMTKATTDTDSARQELADLLAPVVTMLAVSKLDAECEARLNAMFGPDSLFALKMFNFCRAAIEDGWMCSRGEPDLRYGRVIKASTLCAAFSVDIVVMSDVVGPEHTHPAGEADLVLPLNPHARFDGRPAGWVVYPPGSSHAPTVTEGSAIVLYLLPDGAIDFH